MKKKQKNKVFLLFNEKYNTIKENIFIIIKMMLIPGMSKTEDILNTITLKHFGDLEVLYKFIEENKIHFGMYYERIKQGVEEWDFGSLQSGVDTLTHIKNIISLQESEDFLATYGVHELKYLQKLGLRGYINFLIRSFHQEIKTGFIIIPPGQGKTLLTLLLSIASPHKNIILTDNNTTKTQFLDTASKIKVFFQKISEIHPNHENTSQVIVGGWQKFLQAIENGKIDMSQVNNIFIDEADINSLSNKQQIVLYDFAKNYGVKIVGLSATEHQVKKQISDFYTYDILRFPMPGSLPELYKLGELPNISFTDVYLDSKLILNGNGDIHNFSNIDDKDIDNFIQNSDWIEKILEYHLKYNNGRKFILGMRNNILNEFIVKKAQEKGIQLAYLSGNMSISERNHVIESLKLGRIDGIIGSRLTGRGLDIPDCEVVYNSLLTYSPQMFWQLAGRGMRIDESYKHKKTQLVTFLPNNLIINEEKNEEGDEMYNQDPVSKQLYPLSFETFLNPNFFQNNNNGVIREGKQTFKLSQLSEKEINAIPKVISVLLSVRRYGTFVGRPELLTNMIRSYDGNITIPRLMNYLLLVKGPKRFYEYFQTHKRYISKSEEYEYQKLLKQYLPNGIKNLSWYEEKELLKSYFNEKTYPYQKQEIIAKLVSYHYSIAIALAQNISRGNENILVEDLLQAGLSYLYEKLEGLKKGFRFGTFFTINVLSGMFKYISHNNSTIRIPTHIGDIATKINKLLEKETQKKGGELTYKEKYGIIIDAGPQANLQTMQKNAELILSIIEGGCEVFDEKKHSYSNFQDKTGDILELEKLVNDVLDNDRYGADNPLDTSEGKSLENDKLKYITPKEKKILSLIFGIGISNEHSVNNIAEQYGISTQRIYQIYNLAMKKLRRKSNIFKPFMDDIIEDR